MRFTRITVMMMVLVLFGVQMSPPNSATADASMAPPLLIQSIETCQSGWFGTGCKNQCSSWCLDVCDPMSGACVCNKSVSGQGPSPFICLHCPSNFSCSAQGTCTNGTCVCEKGYTGFDCSTVSSFCY